MRKNSFFPSWNNPYEKRGDNEPVCIADEVPFEIPESWEWVRVGELFQHNTGKALNSSNKDGEMMEYIILNLRKLLCRLFVSIYVLV